MHRLLVLMIVLGGVLCVGSCDSEHKDSFKIATAANMQFVIYELVDAFEQQTGITSEVILGSSGKLTAQITKGAPFDLFLSADMKYPNELFENGYTTGKPEIYAYGNLVLWSVKNDVLPELEVLTSEKVTHIAMGNPKTAPYGVAAMQVVDNTDLYTAIHTKIVFGESLSQTNQFIISQAAEIGFTSKSVVLSAHMQQEGSWKPIDKHLYKPMAQAMVVLKNRIKYSDEAEQFRDFILSLEGRKILHKFGYDIIE